ncbi:hypothetical protein PIB30_054073 [Stylosanthes scabra]|uniref:Replication protein A 70 kDa DNA-binding subunit B/D first OB fold domain-containing protein n=1 Tax=Stylosanthes scabra TaxID=79078 RepID=A0ABU6WH21_9FABA|nr:hypothetical protein [Stylosanthes scabra]
MDKEMSKIQASVRQDLIPKYSNQLKEGSCYVVQNFSVLPNAGLVRVTQHRFQILFEADTIISFCDQVAISNSGLSLYAMDQVLKRTVDYDYLIGRLFSFILPLQNLFHPPVLILQYFKVKVDAGKVLLQNVINVSRILINPDMEESIEFLNRFSIASQCFSRLVRNEVGALVSKIDDESFDWTLLRTIANLKYNNEDGQVFVLGEVKHVLDDPEWWISACVCGHPIVGDDHVFYCQLCRTEVEHIIINAATKLFGKTYSDTFLQLEEDIEGMVQDSLQFADGWSVKNQLISDPSLQSEAMKEMIIHILSLKMCTPSSRMEKLSLVLGKITCVIKNQKWWFLSWVCESPVCRVGNVFYCSLCKVECVGAIPRCVTGVPAHLICQLVLKFVMTCLLWIVSVLDLSIF